MSTRDFHATLLHALGLLLRFAFLAVALLPAALGAQFVPDYLVRPDDFTVLMVPDAAVSEGIEKWTSGHGKFFGKGWRICHG